MAASPVVKPPLRSGQRRPSASLTQLAERDQMEGNEERNDEARKQPERIGVDDIRLVPREEMQEAFRCDEAGQDRHDEIGKANDIRPKDLRLSIPGAATDGFHGPVARNPGPDVAQPGGKRELPRDLAHEPARNEDPAYDAEGLEADQRFPDRLRR